MYCSVGGNTVCHLNTDSAESSFSSNSSGGTTAGVGSEGAEFSSKSITAGKEGKGSGELAGDKDSNPKGEHLGSGSKESGDFESESSVEGSVMVGVWGVFGSGNTVSTGGDKTKVAEEVARVEEMVDKDIPREQIG